MRIQIAEESCTGCGLCEDICPDVFEIRHGVACVRRGVVEEDLEPLYRGAIDVCPMNCISVEMERWEQLVEEIEASVASQLMPA